ncbi:MAG: GIY-YIG nuclease family protein [Salinivirgaceae bacterium]|nr:GIY-YIG nuclease family protein [Salinivirgaceae bacterium]
MIAFRGFSKNLTIVNCCFSELSQVYKYIDFMKFFVYILESSKDDSFYIGQTQNIKARLEKHNSGYNKSTKNKKPWFIKFAIEVDSRSEAMNLERKLKSLKKRDSLIKYMEDHKNKNIGV